MMLQEYGGSLLDNGILKCDLHVHSNHSSDATIEVRDIVNLWEKRGILSMVCDHDSIHGSFEVYREIRKMDRDIPMILAEEVLTSEGDIIGLFLTEQILPSLTAAETIDQIHGQGAISIVPHPFSTLRSTAIGATVLDSIIGQVDIIEGYNGKMMKAGENQMASEYATIHKKPISVGSDAHSPPELGGCFMTIHRFDGPGEFFKCMEKPSLDPVKKI